MVLESLCNSLAQVFPPAPSFTEKDVTAQNGRVFMVTGGNAGVGFELCRMLYATGATVYMASRSKERAEQAITTITTASPAPANPGTLRFIQLDLNDLKSVQTVASSFASHKSKLDVLWNNAGTGAHSIPLGARTAQDIEAMMGMHCVATLLFTTLLMPQLRAAASVSGTPGSVRVVWTSSLLAENGTPAHGIDFSQLDAGTPDRTRNYAVSKAGTWMLGREFARRHPYSDCRILSIVVNPGNLKTGAYDGVHALKMMLVNTLLYEARFGAYTGLFAGLSGDIGVHDKGGYVIPWGRKRDDRGCPRKDIIKAMESGHGEKLWGWCEEQWKPYSE